MITNFVVAVTAGLVLLDQAGLVDGVSYAWLAVMFFGWGFLKTAYDLGSKKKREEEQKAQAEEALKSFIFAMQSMKDSDNSKKH